VDPVVRGLLAADPFDRGAGLRWLQEHASEMLDFAVLAGYEESGA
jgi:hypothetical protein